MQFYKIIGNDFKIEPVLGKVYITASQGFTVIIFKESGRWNATEAITGMTLKHSGYNTLKEARAEVANINPALILQSIERQASYLESKGVILPNANMLNNQEGK
jgi:hypothetical protein